jgi:hypothetical protein
MERDIDPPVPRDDGLVQPLVSSAAALPAASSMSTATTIAPSAAILRALASPMPLPAPVMTATRSCKRCVPVLAMPVLTPPLR